MTVVVVVVSIAVVLLLPGIPVAAKLIFLVHVWNQLAAQLHGVYNSMGGLKEAATICQFRAPVA